MRLLSTLLALLVCTPLAAQDAPPTAAPEADHRAMAARIAESFVQPRYTTLKSAAAAQAAAWTEVCAATPDQPRAQKLQAAFADLVQAWASVELVRYGPVSQNFRYERIAYWPERKNDVQRGMQRLLDGNDVLTGETIAEKSVAVQGLSALERLLWEEGALEALAGVERARRCAVGSAIAANLARITAEIAASWPPLTERLRSDPALAREAVTRFATDLLTVYQVVGDLKLDAPMGKSAAEAKPRLAQWWRSELSNRTMALNLAAAADLSCIVLTGGESKAVLGAVRTAHEIADTLPAPLGQMAGNDAQRVRLLLLRDAVRGARDLSNANVPSALGITLGFNSLDGD